MAGLGWRHGQEHASTRHASSRPTVRELAWAAGFIEGEGTFTWATRTNRVSAAQVNIEPLQRLLALFGGTIRPKKSPTKPQHVWAVAGTRARGVMLTLFPLLSQKRRAQVLAALNPPDRAERKAK